MSPDPFWGYAIIPPVRQSLTTEPKQWQVAKIQATDCLETTPYPDFKFNHMFPMLVVGPSQYGKTYFVEQLLMNNRVKNPSKKQRRILWFYSQWQRRYGTLQSTLGIEIVFTQGLTTLS